jgi:hypothetical protein
MGATPKRFNAIANAKTLVFMKFSFSFQKNLNTVAHKANLNLIAAVSGATVRGKTRNRRDFLDAKNQVRKTQRELEDGMKSSSN